MKKIFLICNRYTANQDIIDKKFGRQIYFAEGLASLNNKVILYCADYKKGENFVREYQKIKIISTKLNIFFLIIYFIKLFNTIKSENPDIIIGGSIPLWGFIGYIISFLLNKKYVYDIQDNYLRTKEGKNQNISILLHKLNLLLIKNISYVNENLLHANVKLNKNILFAPNSIDLLKFKPLNKQNCKKKWNFNIHTTYIGYCGTISKDRGLSELQEAFLLLLKDNKNIKLILAGGIDDAIIIPNNNIIYLGNIHPNEIPSLINALDLVVIPSLENEFTKYCFPYKVLEAMACNQNILMSRAGILDSFKLNSRYYISNPKNISLFKEEMKKQLMNRNNYDLRKIASKFSKNAISQNVNDYLNNILKKKIAIICDNVDNKEKTGTSNYALNIINNFQNDRYNFLIVHKKKVDKLFIDNKELIIPYFGNNFIANAIRKIVVMPLVLLLHNVDLVHETYQMGPFILPFFPYKKIVTVHDVFFKTNPKTHNLPSRIRHTLSLPIILKKVDSIITDSHSSKQDIEKYYNIKSSKINVIHLGVGDKYRIINDQKKLLAIKNKYKLPDKFIVSVSSIEPRKNILTVLKALSYLKTKEINIHYIIAGKKSAPYFKDLQEYINSFNLVEFVTFIDYVTDEDLPFILNLAYLFVLPSFYEGFGLPILEAMACGCPVITSNISSLPEVVGDAGILINPNDEKAIANAIQKIMIDKKYRKIIIQKALHQVIKFTWKNCADQTLAVYNKILYAKK